MSALATPRARVMGAATVTLLGVLLLSACGGASNPSSGAGAAVGAAADSAVMALPPEDAKGAVPAGAPAPTTVQGPQIVRTASVTLESSDVRGVTTRALALVKAASGTVTSQSTQVGQDGHASSSLTIAVPSTGLDALIDQLSALGTVREVTTSAQDVTSQAVDLDARIAALKASIARLRTLMDQAGSVADLLAAEEQLSARQADLDSMTAQRTWLSTQVAQSTLTLVVASPEDSSSAWGLALAGVLVAVAIVGGAGVGIGVLVSRRRRPSPDPS